MVRPLDDDSVEDVLPVAEDTGLIVDVDMLVLDMAVAAVADQAADLEVGVNLSARTLALPELVDRVARVLQAPRFPADQLVLELTENALIAGSATTDRSLAQLSAMGVLLSHDDFGVGYASLNHLRRFPVQSVKIDRSFISDLEESDEDRAIVSGTIDMARRLGLRTVAEGVETRAQAALLVELGCDLLQGFLLGRPSSLADATRCRAVLADGTPASVA